MNNPIIKNKVNDIIKGNNNENVLFVLKGISIRDVGINIEINYKNIVDNKIAYFMSLVGKRNIITYEEFIFLFDFIIAQYKKIIIINNNLYMMVYPIEDHFSNDVRNGLLNHFRESTEEDDDVYIGDIDEYISIFGGLNECDGQLMGSYMEPLNLSDPKIFSVNVFDKKQKDIPLVKDIADNIIDIEDECDYVNLLNNIDEDKDVYIRISNYAGDLSLLREHISLVSYYWGSRIRFYIVQASHVFDDFEHRSEFSEILNKYWGYNEFRDVSVYNILELEKGNKEVVNVSQENIISNIVTQVENCRDDKTFRDVFVTAPTGAGKSVMFQVPAIYLAEKYNMLTIVISPLIGLMNDQVKNLELRKYKQARTINSDISPIVKQEIISKVSDGEYHILYISPETLLSRSDVEQLIGDRTIGMIVIDEAHIVTTWGKQFRPDYWYLGDHIRKLRKKQIETKKQSFLIATFTATAIYHGFEDMYKETVNSLHMLNPITYLGYIKRNDIDIVIAKAQNNDNERNEYELDKFIDVEKLLQRAMLTNKKTLIYFPTVALIERCYEYLRNKKEVDQVAIYYGTLSKDRKQENFEQFKDNSRILMLATKAFGMGIDIDNIEIVAHFAPTGNVCDYVQEIGRAARRANLNGEAYYKYHTRDFKHINRLHGLSTIQPYQLIKVIGKIVELYRLSLQADYKNNFTKKRNAMLLDAENFSYIFGSPISDEDNNINKVKTALLLIQKNFEITTGFSPFHVRPIPMFSIGYFEIQPDVQQKINKKYTNAVDEIDEHKHICKVFLNSIWSKAYSNYSFPQFKYMIYSRDDELDFVRNYQMYPALMVNINLNNKYISVFRKVWDTIKGIVFKKVQSNSFISIPELVDVINNSCNISKYKAQSVCETVLASMDIYRRNFARTTMPIARSITMKNGEVKYQFNVAANSYFDWVERGFRKIQEEIRDGKLYIINDGGSKIKEYSTILGILEVIDCLSFEMLGGANSQLYIYINQLRPLQNILNAPYRYKNRMLENVSERHLLSVKMLTYLYEGDFSSDEMWDILEDYFLGKIPEAVQKECIKENPNMNFSYM